MARAQERKSAITTLVSTSFGKQLREFTDEERIDINAPLYVFQLDGILGAIDILEREGKSQFEITSILENLFFRNTRAVMKLNN